MTIVKLPRQNPQSNGIDPASIEKFIKSVESQQLGLHSFMLVKDGKVVAECWWEPYSAEQPHLLYSLSKSFTSTAAGFAITEGLFSLDDLLINHFPDESSMHISELYKRLKVRHALSMATGHITDTQPVMNSGVSKTWAHAFFEVPLEKEPGTHFLYNSGASYMISALVQKRSGQRLLDYLALRLFEPLGINPLKWEQSPEGIDFGGSGLFITTEDIAKFGLLYLQKGVFGIDEKKRLLPESWIDEATRSHVSNGDDPNSEWAQGYGFQFWRCRHNAYRGDGAHGQFCIIIPEHNVVIAMTAGAKNMGAVMNAVWDNLLPGFGKPAQTEAEDETNLLSSLLTNLSIPFPKQADEVPSQDMLDKWSGAYSLDDKFDAPLEITNLTMKFESATRAEFVIASKTHQDTVLALEETWSDGLFGVWGFHGEKLAKTQGAWISKNHYVLTICCVQTPYIVTAKFDFSNDLPTITISLNAAFGKSNWDPIGLVKQ